MRILPILLVTLLLWRPVLAQTTEVILDPGLPASTQQIMQEIADEAISKYRTEFGFDFPYGLAIVVSGDAAFLARDYAQNLGGPLAVKRRAFEDWIYAEATFNRVYINTSHHAFDNRSAPGKSFHRRAMLYHELFHVLQYQLAGDLGRNCCPESATPDVGPVWLLEGGANYAQHHLLGTLSGYLQWARENAATPDGNLLRGLEGRQGMNSARMGYEMGAMAVQMLVGSHGVERLIEFYAAVATTRIWQGAFEQTFGLTADAFYAEQ